MDKFHVDAARYIFERVKARLEKTPGALISYKLTLDTTTDGLHLEEFSFVFDADAEVKP